MPFQKGQVANPLGAGALGHRRPFTEALTRALLQNDGKKLRALAERLFELAMNGDVQAMKEIVNRLEGMPRQTVDVASDGVTIVMMQRPTITGEKPEPRVIDIPSAGRSGLLDRR